MIENRAIYERWKVSHKTRPGVGAHPMTLHNSLPHDVLMATSLGDFKKYLDTFMEDRSISDH